jgi:hypothetical protein
MSAVAFTRVVMWEVQTNLTEPDKQASIKTVEGSVLFQKQSLVTVDRS